RSLKPNPLLLRSLNRNPNQLPLQSRSLKPNPLLLRSLNRNPNQLPLQSLRQRLNRHPALNPQR
ncbi:MAG: hypothetical protein WBD13_04890, partial [Burkholderiaceae bacterium]